VQEVTEPSKYGIFKQDVNGLATKIIEKPKELI
jgi:dTDP-glucose pyrophosphorylase